LFAKSETFPKRFPRRQSTKFVVDRSPGTRYGIRYFFCSIESREQYAVKFVSRHGVRIVDFRLAYFRAFPGTRTARGPTPFSATFAGKSSVIFSRTTVTAMFSFVSVVNRYRRNWRVSRRSIFTHVACVGMNRIKIVSSLCAIGGVQRKYTDGRYRGKSEPTAGIIRNNSLVEYYGPVTKTITGRRYFRFRVLRKRFYVRKTIFIISSATDDRYGIRSFRY